MIEFRVLEVNEYFKLCNDILYLKFGLLSFEKIGGGLVVVFMLMGFCERLD